ncbi:MAG: hypothetical protein SGARI_007449, partial [Bacillariaceae sp.]
MDALAGPANVSDSDDKSSDGDPMDVDKNDDKLKDDFADVIDQAMLCRQMIENEKGGIKIAGKDIGLFIGATGAGTRFEEQEIGGTEHYEPVQYANPELKSFAVSGSPTSVTVTINAATINLTNGDPITVCDTPGFGDTKGAEMEISNQMGVIHGLKGARSIRPFVVIDYEGMSTARFANLRKTLETVILMMGDNPDFAPFQYIFTRCDAKKSKKIWKKLDHFLNHRDEESSSSNGGDTIFDAFLQDMILKTTPDAIFIDPDDDEAVPSILERLWSKETPRLESPSTTFVEFLSSENAHQLKIQMGHRNARMENYFKEGNLLSCEDILQEQIGFADALPLPAVVKELDLGMK